MPIGPLVHALTGLPGNVRYEFYAVGAVILVITYFIQHIRVAKGDRLAHNIIRRPHGGIVHVSTGPTLFVAGRTFIKVESMSGLTGR